MGWYTVTVSYREHIASEAWREVSKSVKERATWRCQLCGIKELSLASHHSHYDLLGESNEASSCIALCNRCHDLSHRYVLGNGG